MATITRNLGGENDTVYVAGTYTDFIVNAGGGNDTVYGYDGNDARMSGNDTFDGGAGNDSLTGGIGNDSLIGGSGLDTIFGGAGNDTLSGGDDVDRLYGDAGNDLMYGDAGNDSMSGGDGNDTMHGGIGDDLIEAGAGADSLLGGDGNDRMGGGAGNDTLFGGTGNDELQGFEGDDILNGEAGNDTLFGGAGRDTMTGGTGNDTFIASDLQGSGALGDLVTDFSAVNANDGILGNNDLIDLSAYYSGSAMRAFNAANGTAYKNPLEWLRADQKDGLLSEGSVSVNGAVKNVRVQLQENGQAVSASNLTTENTRVVCFTPGTMIETGRGAVPVEALKAGDLVVTRDRGLQPVRWIGVRPVSAAELALDPALRPIRISAGALGRGLPQADLTVSPWHRMVVSSSLVEAETGEAEALIAARNLVDLPGVAVVEDAADVTYIHFMCDQHEVVIANGAATETLNVGINTVQHLSPAAYAEIVALFPELAQMPSVPVRKPMPGDWGRNVARRHAEDGLALAS